MARVRSCCEAHLSVASGRAFVEVLRAHVAMWCVARRGRDESRQDRLWGLGKGVVVHIALLGLSQESSHGFCVLLEISRVTFLCRQVARVYQTARRHDLLGGHDYQLHWEVASRAGRSGTSKGLGVKVAGYSAGRHRYARSRLPLVAVWHFQWAPASTA